MDTPMDKLCDFVGPFWQNSQHHLKIKCNNFVGERKKHKKTQKEVDKEMRR